jgi:hypothetical protein
MPYMSQTERNTYASFTRRVCQDCGETVHKEYCSRCDEFWEPQHKAGCSQAHQSHDKTTCGGDRGIREIL